MIRAETITLVKELIVLLCKILAGNFLLIPIGMVTIPVTFGVIQFTETLFAVVPGWEHEFQFKVMVMVVLFFTVNYVVLRTICRFLDGLVYKFWPSLMEPSTPRSVKPSNN